MITPEHQEFAGYSVPYSASAAYAPLPCRLRYVGTPMSRLICKQPNVVMEILELQWGPTHFNPRHNTSMSMAELSRIGNDTATNVQQSCHMLRVRFLIVSPSLLVRCRIVACTLLLCCRTVAAPLPFCCWFVAS